GSKPSTVPNASTRSVAGSVRFPLSQYDTNACEAATLSPSCFCVRSQNSRASCSRWPSKPLLLRANMAGILFLCPALFRSKRLHLRRSEFDGLELKRSDLSGFIVQRNPICFCDRSTGVRLDQNHVFHFTRRIDLHGKSENAIHKTQPVNLQGQLLLV